MLQGLVKNAASPRSYQNNVKGHKRLLEIVGVRHQGRHQVLMSWTDLLSVDSGGYILRLTSTHAKVCVCSQSVSLPS
jgi:hypothetical protein